MWTVPLPQLAATQGRKFEGSFADLARPVAPVSDAFTSSGHVVVPEELRNVFQVE